MRAEGHIWTPERAKALKPKWFPFLLYHHKCNMCIKSRKWLIIADLCTVRWWLPVFWLATRHPTALSSTWYMHRWWKSKNRPNNLWFRCWSRDTLLIIQVSPSRHWSTLCCWFLSSFSNIPPSFILCLAYFWKINTQLPQKHQTPGSLKADMHWCTQAKGCVWG